VTRRSCPGDVRGVIAELTDEGMDTLRRAAPGHVAAVRDALIDPLTPEQLDHIAEGLGEVSRRLRGCGGSGTVSSGGTGAA